MSANIRICRQISNLAGIPDSSIPGFLQACGSEYNLVVLVLLMVPRHLALKLLNFYPIVINLGGKQEGAGDQQNTNQSINHRRKREKPGMDENLETSFSFFFLSSSNLISSSSFRWFSLNKHNCGCRNGISSGRKSNKRNFKRSKIGMQLPIRQENFNQLRC